MIIMLLTLIKAGHSLGHHQATRRIKVIPVTIQELPALQHAAVLSEAVVARRVFAVLVKAEHPGLHIPGTETEKIRKRSY